MYACKRAAPIKTKALACKACVLVGLVAGEVEHMGERLGAHDTVRLARDAHERLRCQIDPPVRVIATVPLGELLRPARGQRAEEAGIDDGRLDLDEISGDGGRSPLERCPRAPVQVPIILRGLQHGWLRNERWAAGKAAAPCAKKCVKTEALKRDVPIEQPHILRGWLGAAPARQYTSRP
eukprot:scaffold6552_cov26-Tisochrysis_lutea.AAC.4